MRITGAQPVPLTFFRSTPIANADSPLNGANVISRTGVVISYWLTFSKIGVDIGTTDAVDNYDLGLYTAAGGLVANIGAQTLPTGNVQSFATVQGVQTIAPGLYVFAWTGNAATAQLAFGNNDASWVCGNSATTSTGGALPASIAASTVSVSTTCWYFFLQ
jgi:hypothetical protein